MLSKAHLPGDVPDLPVNPCEYRRAELVERLLGDLDTAVAHGEGAQTLAELLARTPSLDPPAARS